MNSQIATVLTITTHMRAAASRLTSSLRVKPVARPTNRITLDTLSSTVAFNIPRDSAAG